MDGAWLKLSNVAEFKIIEHTNEWNEVEEQELFDPDGEEIFFVKNLDQEPEDAIIRRSLVAAQDIVYWIDYGVKLATEQGVDIVKISYGDE